VIAPIRFNTYNSGRSSSIWLLLLMVLLCAGPALCQGTQAEDSGFSALMVQTMQVAEKVRATPITEPGIPIGQVSGKWEIKGLKLEDDTFIATFELAPQYLFYVQSWICHRKDEPASFFDATTLGDQETAATFYAANLSFYTSDDMGYIRCMKKGMEISSVIGRPKDAKGTLNESELRVLQGMSNWLLFLAKFRQDKSRSSDFLPFILDHYRLHILAVSDQGGAKDVASAIEFFDDNFPFEVFDLNIPLTTGGKQQAHEFFRTVLLARNRLKVLSPEVAGKIDRDTELMKRYQ
jgi:hypothetical protein